jgi:flagellar motor switch protein FliM
MPDGTLSQDEINALLASAESGLQDLTGKLR